ncbi:MAG: glutathione S-transferase family protein [Pseudomonadota bacterium]
MTDALMLHGAPGSPYTRKMLAVLRYRRIPYRLIVDREAHPELPTPKVQLLPTFFLPSDDGELEAVVDSTPLIRRFDSEFAGREIVPNDPVLAFIDELIEDYGDEWLTKAMFHYRWYYEADIERGGEILPRWRGISKPEAEIQAMKSFIQERQISRLYVVGSNDTTAPVIEASYGRFLTLMSRLLERRPFVLGDRPGSADFALYGQLTALTAFDPTPMALAYETAPRVCAWVQLMEDLSGSPAEPDGWLTRDEMAAHLGEFIGEIGRVYAPALLANHAAIQDGAEQVQTSIDGQPWVQPPFPYQARCLMALRTSYHRLGDADRAAVDALLAGSGVDALFVPPA